MAPPPPPPPPICLPFIGSKKPKRRLSFSSLGPNAALADSTEKLKRMDSQRSADSYSSRTSSTGTMTNASAGNMTTVSFRSDSEKYDEIPDDVAVDRKGRVVRSNTMTGTKHVAPQEALPPPKSSKWSVGFGLGKKKDTDAPAEVNLQRGVSQRTLPVFQETSQPPTRQNSRSTQASKRTQDTHRTHRSDSKRSQTTTKGSLERSKSARTPYGLTGYRASQDTLVQSDSIYRRKADDVASVRQVTDTTERVEELRTRMAREKLDIYVVPSVDAHQSEYVAASDKRRQYMTGFSGSSGEAIITDSGAYLVTDSRYWMQALEQMDRNWKLVRAGSNADTKDWVSFIESIGKNKRVGIDGRMLSYDTAISLSTALTRLGGKLVYPVQNLVDLIWKDKPSRSKDPVFIQPKEYSGEDASSKLAKLKSWLEDQPPDRPGYSKDPPKPQHYQIGVLITALDQIAYLLNLRGSDIPYNPLFHAYLFIGLNTTVLFLERSKVNDEVAAYLSNLNVERQDYSDIWTYLRKREWGGEGKIIMDPSSSYTIALVLSSYRTTIMRSPVQDMIAIKNETELAGLRKAYLRDGVAFVQFLAWLEDKILSKGYDISEWEASQRLLEFRKKQHGFMGLAYATISGSGPNGALPHYSPRKGQDLMIDKSTPYVNDSGGQYRDGTCDTTRTIHLGRPNAEMCEAFTRVLQGHIAIDTAVFPEGTSGKSLDVLARNALWKEGMNYGHGTGHGFGSFLTVHEGPQSFSSDVPLRANHVITNEPGYYVDGKWGIRIESALAVRRVRTRHEFGGAQWLSFERLTCVPIQLKMVNREMLTSTEKTWLINHNKECFRKLKPFLLNTDKRAFDWLKRETNREIGIAAPGPGGITIDWG